MAEEMGSVDVCEVVEIGSDRCIVFRQENTRTRTVSLVLRGATLNVLDDVERAVDNGVNAVKMITRDPRLVAGTGACEMALARRISEVGEKTSGVAALGVKAFAEALEVIPRVLSENAGLDATGVVSLLYAAHAKDKSHSGVNIEAESMGIIGVSSENAADESAAVIKDVMTEATPYPVLDSLAAKKWALKYASDAALTVLRVDQIIMSKPAGGPKLPKGGNAAYDEDSMA